MAKTAAPKRDIMLAQPYDSERVKKQGFPVIVQPKIDGLRCKATIAAEGMDVSLMSSQGNEFTSIPHIKKALLEAYQLSNEAKKGEQLVLDGELYCDSIPFESICSIVKRNSPHPDMLKIQYHIFDIINEFQQTQRLHALDYFLHTYGNFSYLYPVPSVWCNSEDEIFRQLASNMRLGYEGIIVRWPDALYQPKRVTTLLKFKPQKQDIYEILRVEEEISIDNIPKGSLGAFVCAEIGSNLTFNVGTGPLLTAAERWRLWQQRETLPGKLIVVKYQKLTARGVPRHPVAISLMDRI